MTFHLKIWRQASQKQEGFFQTMTLREVSPDMSFLEMLDYLNLTLLKEDPVFFDHDCREGICGMCSLTINKIPHGGSLGRTTCQLYMRQFEDNSTITIEPFIAKSFPILKDLAIDRSSFDQILQEGGFISVNVGSAPEAHQFLVSKKSAEKSLDASSCIGCGACVATCKNSSGLLFLSAKIAQYEQLPQGQIEQDDRLEKMLKKHDELFGPCSNTQECEAVCPKMISTENIALLFKKALKKIF